MCIIIKRVVFEYDVTLEKPAFALKKKGKKEMPYSSSSSQKLLKLNPPSLGYV